MYVGIDAAKAELVVAMQAGAQSRVQWSVSNDERGIRALVATSTVVTDISTQCASVGELHHAIHAGFMRVDDVHAEIGQIIAGAKSGRADAGEVILYDSTGTAIQDVACAAAAYRKAVMADRGVRVGLGQSAPSAASGAA